MSWEDEIAATVVRDGAATMCAVGWAVAGAARATGGATSTFFDLASLTKPMTAVALARSGIPRETALVDLLPEVSGLPAASATLEDLLAHRAGLEAHLFLPADRGEALRAAASARRTDPSGPVYSDLGYVLAGEALARATGVRDAGEAIARLVVQPLGLGAELGTARELEAAGVDLVARAAPTEVVPARGGAIRGRVHDENAWALTGDGGSGHAGMFGTIGAVLAFAVDALAGVLRGELAWLVEERAGGTLRAGFDGKSAEGSSAGVRMGPRAFGHLGFTGTSFWIDPDTGVVVSLLTNRVYPTRESASIRAARPRVHDALYARALA